MAILERDLDQPKALDDIRRLAEVDQPRHRSLTELAFFKSEIDDAQILGRLDRKEQTLDPDMIQTLHSDCDTLVERCLDGDGFVMPQVFVIGEADEQVLPGQWLLWLVLLLLALVFVSQFSLPLSTASSWWTQRRSPTFCCCLWRDCLVLPLLSHGLLVIGRTWP